MMENYRKNGRMIIVFGLPGSGKSYFASSLAVRLNADHISSDAIRNKILNTKTYSTAEKLNVYQAMFEAAGTALDAGKIVVLDATFYLASLRDKALEIAKQHKTDACFIEIHADEDLVRERMRQSRQDSDADHSVYLRVKSQFEAMEDDHFILHSRQDNIEEMLKEAVAILTPGCAAR